MYHLDEMDGQFQSDSVGYAKWLRTIRCLTITYNCVPARDSIDYNFCCHWCAALLCLPHYCYFSAFSIAATLRSLLLLFLRALLLLFLKSLIVAASLSHGTSHPRQWHWEWLCRAKRKLVSASSHNLTVLSCVCTGSNKSVACALFQCDGDWAVSFSCCASLSLPLVFFGFLYCSAKDNKSII